MNRHPGRRAVAIGLVLAGLAVACGRSSAPATDTPTIPFEKYTLPNGLDVILSEDHRLPLVAVDVWYHVGPANEAAGRTGFAHLFEHLMFQGSKHVPGDSHFRLLEAAGATDVNGTTSFDRTNYFETLPSNQLDLGLWLESDRMGYLLDSVDELKLANQQDVVRNERRQSIENQPYGIVEEAVFHELFPKGHPYYASIMGTHADIQAAKLEDVKNFFKQYYRPNNASLAIVGDFDKATIKGLVDKYFGTLKRGPDVAPPTVTTPPITSEKRAIVKDRVQLSRVYMAWLTPPFFKPGDADADAAASVLGGGDSSRLYKTLVYDRQIAQDVTASQRSMGLTSVFEIEATVRPGHTPAEVEQGINEIVEGLRQQAPDAREVERARNTFETQVLSDLETLGGFGGVADTLNMFNHYVHDPGYLPTYLQEHRAVTPASVQAFAQKYLTPTARVVVWAEPGQPDLGPTVPTPPAPKVAAGTGAESVNAEEAWRDQPPAPGPTPTVSLPTPRSFTLDNGLTVIELERHGMPVAAARLVLKTGGDANPADRSGLANFTAAMLDQGTSTRDALTIADDAAQIGASLGASSSKDSIAVGIGSLVRNFGAALDLLADVTLHPTFPQAEVERQRTSRAAQLTAATQDPGTVASVAAVNALYGADHPYGYIELGTREALDATTRDDLVSFWRRNFVPSNAALVVAGELSEAELRPLVEKAFGAWPRAAAPAVTVAAPTPPAPKIVIADLPGAPQTFLLVAGLSPARSTPDYAAINVMNDVLGGLFSSRINLNLREDHGYTYGAGSQFTFRKGEGPFVVQTSVRTDVTAPAVREIFKELRRMTAEPMSADELAMAKDAIIRGLPSDFETSSRVVSVLGNLYVYDLGLDYYAKFPGMVSSVTADTALAAAKKYLKPGQMIVVAAGDRAKIEAPLRQLGIGPVVVQPAPAQ
jgi:zinc protease